MKRLKIGIVAGLLALGLTIGIGNAQMFRSEASSLDEVKQLVNENYPFTYDEKAADSGAAAGFINGLGDPYTTYFSAKEAESFVNDVNQALTGIGVRIEPNELGARVVDVMQGSPAIEAGLAHGDIINAIGGESVSGKSIEEISAKIRGEAGSKVSLTVLKYDISGNNYVKREYTMIRRAIDVPHVDYELLPGNIALITVHTFGDKTVDEFNQSLLQAAKAQASSMIIDLRGDGGGYLDAAVDLADWFTDGPAVYLAYKNQAMEPLMTAKRSNIALPVVALVDAGTASASEVLAACMQDNGKQLIGTKTFGKGVVQQMFRLDSGDYVKLTVASFYSPKKHAIQKIGLTPDQYAAIPDMQLVRGISVVSGRQVKSFKINANGRDATSDITGDRLLNLSAPVRSDATGVWYPLPDVVEAFGGSFDPGIKLQLSTADPLAGKPIAAEFRFAGTSYSFDVSKGEWKDAAGKTMPGKLKLDATGLYANQDALKALGIMTNSTSGGGYAFTLATAVKGAKTGSAVQNLLHATGVDAALRIAG